NLFADPLFVAAPTVDFTSYESVDLKPGDFTFPTFVVTEGNLELQRFSFLVDRGLSQGAPTRDFLGNPRPCHEEVDVGAYEFCGDAPSSPPVPRFRRGDSNADGRVDISDSIMIFTYLFLGGTEPPCLDAADVDDTGVIDLTDGLAVNLFLFLNGRDPATPGPFRCGADPTPDDDVSCELFPPCTQ
ncbi:MAG: choice-of-anchor Q domain-containing protein, partial [Planctomycetota bacterium]